VTPTKCAFIGLDPKLHEYTDRFVMAASCEDRRGTDTLLRHPDARAPERGERHAARKGRRGLSPRHLPPRAGPAGDGARQNRPLRRLRPQRIINIINRAEDILGRAPDYVFAGFHLYNPSLGQSEPRALVDAVGERLRARKATRYVTGHCTGDDAYAWLHETLGDRLAYMATGTTFTI